MPDCDPPGAGKIQILPSVRTPSTSKRMSLILRARAVADGLGIAEILAFSGLATHGRTFPTLHQSTRWPHEPMKFGVTSSCLCKYGEGAGFPFQIESLEDGVNDSIHAFYVDKAHHGAGS